MSETQKNARSAASFIGKFSVPHLPEPLSTGHTFREATDLRPTYLSTLTQRHLHVSAAGDFVLSRGMNLVQIRAQVGLAAPFLFSDTGLVSETWIIRAPFLKLLLQTQLQEEEPSDISESFKICMAAIWATAGTSLPIDLDHQIRFKFWNSLPEISQLEALIDITLDAYAWPTEGLTGRSTQSGITGHHGEWLAVAVAAYAASRNRLPMRAAEVLEQIQFEVTREAKVYCEVKRGGDGVELLKVAAVISLNLSLLDRGCEEWSLLSGDPLVDSVYRASHEEGDARRFNGALYEAGLLNKALMAAENHRHITLRMVKSLRRSPELLLPIGPFFDDFGAALALDPMLNPRDYAEIVESLLQGWEKLKGPLGHKITYAYPRALSALIENFPGGLDALSEFLPSDIVRSLRFGLLRSLTSVSRSRFEEQWSQMAMAFVHGKARIGTPSSLLHTVSEI